MVFSTPPTDRYRNTKFNTSVGNLFVSLAGTGLLSHIFVPLMRVSFNLDAMDQPGYGTNSIQSKRFNWPRLHKLSL